MPRFVPRLANVALGAALVVVCPALAAEPQGQPAKSSWSIHLSPYLWSTGIDGTTTVGGAATDITIAFDELLSFTNAGFRLLTTAKKGDWIIAADLTRADLGLSEVDQIAAIEVDLEQIILAATASYRVLTRAARLDPDPGLRRDHGLDLQMGLRYWDFAIDTRVAFHLLPPGQLPPELRLRGDDRWVDLLIGASYSAPVSRRLAMSAAANLGGFGIGSSSRITWEAAVIATFVATGRWALSGGYRALLWDRTTSEDGVKTRTEMMLHGPLLGATYSF